MAALNVRLLIFFLALTSVACSTLFAGSYTFVARGVSAVEAREACTVAVGAALEDIVQDQHAVCVVDFPSGQDAAQFLVWWQSFTVVVPDDKAAQAQQALEAIAVGDSSAPNFSEVLLQAFNNSMSSSWSMESFQFIEFINFAVTFIGRGVHDGLTDQSGPLLTDYWERLLEARGAEALSTLLESDGVASVRLPFQGGVAVAVSIAREELETIGLWEVRLANATQSAAAEASLSASVTLPASILQAAEAIVHSPVEELILVAAQGGSTSLADFGGLEDGFPRLFRDDGVEVEAMIHLDLFTSKGARIAISDLESPFNFTLGVQRPSLIECAVWDVEHKLWSTAGLAAAARTIATSTVTCSSTHMSLFAGVVRGFLDSSTDSETAVCSDCEVSLSAKQGIAALAPGDWWAKPASVVLWLLATTRQLF